MSITTEILRIKGGKSDIRTMIRQKNIEIPSSLRIDEYANYIGQKWPNLTLGVSYDGTKIRGSIKKWNQFINKVNLRPSETIGGITFTNNGDGSITISGTATGNVQRIVGVAYLQVGHRILLIDNTNDLNTLNKHWFSGNGDSAYSNLGTVSNAYNNIQFYISSGMSVNLRVFFKIVDLTDIFGSGNEPENVNSPEIADVVEYAKNNPEYSAGGLRYSYYKGIKLGSYDYIDTADNILHIGGAETDLGSLTYNRFIYGSSYLFFAANPLQKHNTENYICPIYETYKSIFNIPDKRITGTGGSGNSIWIRDDSYTDVNLLKQSLNGIPLYYELATPIEIDLS